MLSRRFLATFSCDLTIRYAGFADSRRRLARIAFAVFECSCGAGLTPIGARAVSGSNFGRLFCHFGAFGRGPATGSFIHLNPPGEGIFGPFSSKFRSRCSNFSDTLFEEEIQKKIARTKNIFYVSGGLYTSMGTPPPSCGYGYLQTRLWRKVRKQGVPAENCILYLYSVRLYLALSDSVPPDPFLSVQNAVEPGIEFHCKQTIDTGTGLMSRNFHFFSFTCRPPSLRHSAHRVRNESTNLLTTATGTLSHSSSTYFISSSLPQGPR